MNKKKEVLLFAGGLCMGALVTYIYYRRKKKTVLEKNMDNDNGFVPIDEPPVDDWREEKEQNEVDYSNIVDKLYGDGDSQGVTHYTPYTISPDDYFDESYEDYEKEALTYYADGILARDGNDEVIKDPEEVVGPNSLSSFGEYEEDAVYVRDDSGRIQYEITRDRAKYVDVVGNLPDEDDDE